MGAISIAFDITIAGALALPWVLLVVHLFFADGEEQVSSLPGRLKELDQAAAVAVLLFAVTYLLGSVVSRTAQDFANDDDLHVRIGRHLFRVGVTEDRIRTSVLCNEEDLLTAAPGNSALTTEIRNFRDLGTTSKFLCKHALRWGLTLRENQKGDDVNENARNIFGFQEAALLLKGEDATLRLRQLHDQIMVLRAAAFNGLITFSLCLFAWGARAPRQSRAGWARWVLLLIPALYLTVGTIALVNHGLEANNYDPPYMEFSMLLLGAAGMWLIWNQAPQSAAERTEKHGRSGQWAKYVGLSAILTVTAILAWWSTEVVYAQQVIYSYNTQSYNTQTSPHP
jgi:hypothetical protein